MRKKLFTGIIFAAMVMVSTFPVFADDIVGVDMIVDVATNEEDDVVIDDMEFIEDVEYKLVPNASCCEYYYE